MSNQIECMQLEQVIDPRDIEVDDDKNSGGSSSSISMTDSDISSGESEDSLELSESESITDVTPLNSPYCDSPLPQVKGTDAKYDIPSSSHLKSLEYGSTNEYHLEEPNTTEMNILIKAIKKLEVEKDKKIKSENHGSYTLHKKKSVSFSGEVRRMDQDNQRLLKHVITQQNRMKPICSTQNHLCHKPSAINRHRQLRQIDVDSSMGLRRMLTSKPRDYGRSHANRQQKCFSHPSCYTYNHTLLDSKLSADGSSLKNLCSSVNDASPIKEAETQGTKFDVPSHEFVSGVEVQEEMNMH